jgi:N-acetylglucosamine-6-sulfatase
MRRRPWRAAFLVGAAVVVVLAALALTRLQGMPRACRGCPNVIVFETDDQTVADMAALPRVRSLIGRQGVTFDNSFVNLSECCPSRATFMTGEYAHNHGVLSNHPPDGGFYRLNSDNTLAVWMHDAGYRTVMIGKYLNDYGTKGPDLIPPGWDDWNAAVAYPNEKDDDAQQGNDYFLSYYRKLYNRNGRIVRLPPGLYRTDADAATARAAIRSAARSSQPFFMWLPFVAAHQGTPVEPDDPPDVRTPAVAPKYRDHFRSLPLPRPPNFNEADISDKPQVVRRARLTPEKQRAFRELFQQRREALLSVDAAVASIISTLRKTGQLAHTLIIFTSDNGFMLGEHRLGPRQEYIYEPAIRVPLLMRGPGIPHDQHRSQMVINADLAPTIIEAAHATAGLPVDGRSLLPLIRNPHMTYRRDLLIMVGRAFGKRAFWGLRTRRYAYAEYRKGQTELYDLRHDPWELTNRADDPRYARLRARLHAELGRLRHCRGKACSSGPTTPPS